MVYLKLSMAKKKESNPTAVELGRKGGQARVPKGFAMLTPKQRTALAKKAGKASAKAAAEARNRDEAGIAKPGKSS